MPRYLLNATYTIQGVEGVRSTGGTDRRAAVTDAAHSVGGELESFYIAFGDRDVVAIVDLPDDKAAAAVGLIVNAAGGARVNTTVLITPEEIDEAAHLAVSYRPPGL